MGACTDVSVAYIADPKEAYRHLVDEALYDHGHSGYSGTISESNGYRVYDRKVRLLPEAEEFAWHLANEVAQKWEHALCVPFVDTYREVEITLPEYLRSNDSGPAAYGKAIEKLKEVALAELRSKRMLRRGESVAEARLTSYTEPRRDYYYGSRPMVDRLTNVRMSVRINRAPSALTPEKIATMEPDGWVFGGCYSS